ncbi:AAA family ATPase [Vagococcus carniphilus]|uniref:AAA family ATPase n=1 Tax=Vagococcus carniphilus TaxID=218144 RepID=UPI002891E4D6|nr:AAA family ATPase [Vagococcus carniphilus]MDT2829722.1 AAA family ATPase [Vagococcus carniphilus]MDT2853239.1 AAA family ATPase [Vagococcus carniphilus]
MSYKLEQLQINKFRNIDGEIKPFNLKFKPGINVISGHNGVGKSNILSLVSSSTGINNSKTPSGNSFQPEFYEYFKIGKNEEFKNYEIYSVYKDELNNYVTKELRFKDDTASNRGIRIIPTTSNKLSNFNTLTEAKDKVSKQFGIGPEARIKIPTRYISISRLFPLGESDLSHTDFYKSSTFIKNNYDQMFRNYYNSVLEDSIAEDSKMYISSKREVKSPNIGLEIKNTNRNSKSVGQDSLDTIVSSIIDFKYLKDTLDTYKGGILCIDELDISFHPNAQIKLINLLEDISKDLNLQIFVTTHSLTVINEISKKIERANKKKLDVMHSINYIRDKKMPFITQKNNYTAIKADMFSERHLVPTKIKFYFEDEIAINLHNTLMNIAKKIFKDDIEYDQSEFTYINAKIGKSQLRHLNDVDQSYFRTVGIVLDGDSRYADNNPVNVSEAILNDILDYPKHKDEFNVLILPYVLPPEAYLYKIFRHYVKINDRKECQEFWITMDETNDLAESREFFEEHNFLINDDDLTTETIKNNRKLNEIINFIYKNNVLEFYFKYDEKRKQELLSYAKKFNSITMSLKNKINSNKR